MWDLIAGTEDNVSMGNVLTTWNFEPQPTHRGTFGILSTCFVTLALCTWKIVHLNLPGTCPDAALPWTAWWKRGTTKSMRHRLVHIFGGHQISRQIGWLLIGLFAPELIAFAAFEQYWAARSLQAYMEEVYLKQPKNPTWWPAALSRQRVPAPLDDVEQHDADKPVWTMTHSWYAVMGGYSYDLREGSFTHLPDDRGRESLILRDEALRFVAKHEPSIIPRLTVADIMDKAGAGAFVKIITLFQAIWFSLQCIARMGQGLSISLLELTTFAHCVVGLVIGWLWLQKPLDISMPDALDIPDGVLEPHWLMAMLYSLTGFDKEESDDDRWRKMASETKEKLEAQDPEQKTPGLAYLDPLNEHRPLSFTEFDVARPGTSAARSTRPSSSRPGTGLGHRRSRTAPRSPATPPTAGPSITDLIQSAANNDRRLALRMQLARKGWEHYVLNPPQSQPAVAVDVQTLGNQTSISPTKHPAVVQRKLKHTLRDTLVDRVPNFPRHRAHAPGATLHKPNTIRTHIGIALTGFLYGGLHLLAWDSSFITTVEQTVWRIAALSLAASGLFVPVAHAEGFLRDVARPWLEMDEEDRDAEEAAHLESKKETMGRSTWKVYRWFFSWMIEVMRVGLVVGVALVGGVYFGLRLFIMVEALLGLGHLPPSAYEVVRWSTYVPHIS
ncbi:unnamed protein product [Discula destructiva]